MDKGGVDLEIDAMTDGGPIIQIPLSAFEPFSINSLQMLSFEGDPDDKRDPS